MRIRTTSALQLLAFLLILPVLVHQLAWGGKTGEMSSTVTSNGDPRHQVSSSFKGNFTCIPIPDSSSGAGNPVDSFRGTESLTRFEENFDHLKPGEIPEGWYVYDNDGNGYSWDPSFLYPYEGDNYVQAHWNSAGSDDWLVTPMLSIPGGGDAVQFYARASLESFPENWEVWKNTEGRTPHHFLTYGTKIGEDSTSSTSYEHYSYYINTMMGDDMWLAVRHTSDGDGGRLLLDAFEMSSTGVSEGFEGDPVFPPPYWNHEVVEPGPTDQPEWVLSDGTWEIHPPGVTPHSGEYMIEFNSYFTQQESSARLSTYQLNFAYYMHNMHILTFWMYHDSGWPGNPDTLEIQLSIDGGIWGTVAFFARIDGTEGWRQHSVDLSSYSVETSVAIGFLGVSGYGNNIYIDDIILTSSNEAEACSFSNFIPIVEGGYAGFYEEGLGTYMYFNPKDNCFDHPYPVDLQSILLRLWDFGECTWPVELDVVIYDNSHPLDYCIGFGEELCRYSFTADSATFGVTLWGEFEFPEPCCIYGPFYAGIEYRSGVSSSTPSVIFDGLFFPLACEAWMKSGEQVYKWSDFWAGSVGYPWFAFTADAKCPDCDRHVLLHSGLQQPPPVDSNVTWEQIWPSEDNISFWHQDGWTDDGDNMWSKSDTLDVSMLPERDSLRRYQVEQITQALKVRDVSTMTYIVLEYVPLDDTISYWNPPVATLGFWQIVWPARLHRDILFAFIVTDNNSNDIIDWGDVMDLQDEDGVLYQVNVYDTWNSLTASLLSASFTCGDADASGDVDIDDVVYLIAYIFSGGPAPQPYESGDANCAGGVDIDDVVYLIAYIFSGGNAPCDTNGDGVPDC